MSAGSSRPLRWIVPILLALLAVQFEFGITANLAGPPSLAPFAFSLSQISIALAQAGSVACIHALLGCLLVVFSLVSLYFSLASRRPALQAFGALAFATTTLAAITGLLFVLSGFQNDGDSHGMATNFLLAYSFYFVELYFLKPIGRTRGEDTR